MHWRYCERASNAQRKPRRIKVMWRGRPRPSLIQDFRAQIKMARIRIRAMFVSTGQLRLLRQHDLR